MLPLLLDRIKPHWPQRSFLRRLLRALEVDCVLDVGAHGGEYGAELRDIGYRGAIVSFEPDPAVFERLSARAAGDPDWHVLNLALASAAGTMALNVMELPQFNSFRAPSERETDIYRDENKVVRRVEVPVETLSSLLPSLEAKHGFCRPFLKMDTQGFDLEVFAGAAGVRERLVGMQTELSVLRIYEDTPLWHEALQHYQNAGFELVGLYPVNPHLLKLVEFDCYLVRKS